MTSMMSIASNLGTSSTLLSLMILWQSLKERSTILGLTDCIIEKVFESRSKNKEYCTSIYLMFVELLSGYSVFFVGIYISFRHFITRAFIRTCRSFLYFDTSRKMVMTMSIKEGENSALLMDPSMTSLA